MEEKYFNECYYCGNPSSSREHVPPKQMFKGLICDKITVPSCEKHNGKKSMDDDSIIKAMLLSLMNISQKKKQNEKVINIINLTKKHFPQVKKYVSASFITDDLPEELMIEFAYLSRNIDIHEWMRQLTAGIVFDVIEKYDSNNKFSDAKTFSPSWIPAKHISEYNYLFPLYEKVKNIKSKHEFYESFNWHNLSNRINKSYPSELYKLSVNLDKEETILFKHTFFGNFTWYVTLNCSIETYQGIINVVEKFN